MSALVNHRLVKQRHALRDLTPIDEAATVTDPAQRDQLRVAETVTDLGWLGPASAASTSPSNAQRREAQ